MEWSLRRKTYKHPCPDGSLKIVHRSIDDAFPLVLKHVGTRLALDLAKLSEIGGQVGAEYRESIAGLLYSLDDLNQSLMMNFRAVYAAYQSDPCANAEFLARQVGKMVEETQRHTEIQVRISGLIGLAQTDGGKRDKMLALFRELVLEVGGPTVGVAAASEVEQAKEDARRWIGESGAETEESR